jgi:transcriptional regulator with GAF, ATPase, and Fis domain
MKSQLKAHVSSIDDVASHDPNGNARGSTSRLRRLFDDLVNEMELLDEHTLSPEVWGDRESICFYEEVVRFEIALITTALRRANGHQLKAARLLNLNPTTLNAKIKQYQIRVLS